MDENQILNRIKQLEQNVFDLNYKQVRQEDISPDTIKMRHVGEGVRYIRADVAANRPASGEQAGATFFATDTFVLSCWTGTLWKTTTLS